MRISNLDLFYKNLKKIAGFSRAQFKFNCLPIVIWYIDSVMVVLVEGPNYYDSLKQWGYACYRVGKP